MGNLPKKIVPFLKYSTKILKLKTQQTFFAVKEIFRSVTLTYQNFKQSSLDTHMVTLWAQESKSAFERFRYVSYFWTYQNVQKWQANLNSWAIKKYKTYGYHGCSKNFVWTFVTGTAQCNGASETKKTTETIDITSVKSK